MRYRFFVAFAVLSCFLVTPAIANNDFEVNFIINAKNPPIGVIFEVVEGKQSDLEWALPQIQKYTKMIREKHPAMKFAVVSHGREEFALLTENQQKMAKTHQRVKSLVNDDIPVHVCGTHASWYDKDKSDFPDYVDVVDAGPAQVKAYQRKGYNLIVVEKP